MMNKHAKSPCCSAPVRRYGQRRRQCGKCFTTWSIRKKKRGRKPKRSSLNLLHRILQRKETSTDAAIRCQVTPAAIQKRVRRILTKFSGRAATPPLPGEQLILVVDGMWTYFQKEGRYTLYLIAVRHVEDTVAHFLDPIFLPGRESADGWRAAFATIPDDIKQRICAVVSDGLRGLKEVVQENGWIFQRCHFHLLAWFQPKHGQSFQRQHNKWIRDAILGYIRAMLETKDRKKLQEFRKELEVLIKHPDCLSYYGKRVREFLKTIDDFRTCLRHPELNLPTTSNTVEAMIRNIRNLLRHIHGARTPQSFIKWVKAYIHTRGVLTCNGRKSTEISR